jgi:hypothetical protein
MPEVKAGDGPSDGYLNGSYTAAVLKNGIVNVLIDYSEYAPGAAHPWGVMASINYDSRTCRVLTLASLFRPWGQIRVAAITIGYRLPRSERICRSRRDTPRCGPAGEQLQGLHPHRYRPGIALPHVSSGRRGRWRSNCRYSAGKARFIASKEMVVLRAQPDWPDLGI